MPVYDEYGVELSSVYDEYGSELDYAYDEYGNVIYSKSAPSYPTSFTQIYSTAISGSGSSQSPQGMATYGDYIFQFWAIVDKMRIYRKSDFTMVSELDCTVIGHGNNLQFGTEVQANGFPLLYASDSLTADARYIYVVSVDLNNLTLVDTITLPSAVGNYPNVVIDFENELIYSFGYTGSTVYVTSGKNIMCVLDLNNPSTVIKSIQYDYLGVEQGMVWNGEQVIVNCNTWDGIDVKFYFIDPSTLAIAHTSEFEKEYDCEVQGFSDEGDYYLVSKWVYKNVPSTRTLWYEFYRMD